MMDAVEEIKSRLSIEDVVSRYVELKRAGRNMRGLSPFNNEKTPSFMVSPEKQIWHDFSSGKGGNVFSFVMEMEGLDFKGALELLARQAGVDLEQFRGSSKGRGEQKERIYQALDTAAKFYQAHLGRNKQALDYVLKTRRFSKDTALLFKIGYSPSSKNSLSKFLLGKGFKLQELKAAGLVVQRYSDPSDMFRGRIMIPLMDPFGRVIGFTARQLESNSNPSASSGSDSPKYINTPSTVLYDKSRHVYGLHLAKDAIRKSGYAVVAEGNLDVIASYQAGIKQVVATAGTALTSFHLKSISRFANDIRLAFDQDKAGQDAVVRSIPIANKIGVSLSIITISGGKDPDELIKNDPKLWEKALENNIYALDWLIEHHKSELDIDSAEGKRRLSDKILPIVGLLDDQVEKDHYVVQLSRLIGVSSDSMREKLGSLKNTAPSIKPRKTVEEELPKDDSEIIKVQDHFLSILLKQPALRYFAKEIIQDMLNTESAKAIWSFLKSNEDFNGDPLARPELKQVEDYVKILDLQYEELYRGLELLELRNEAARLQARTIENYVKSEKQKLIKQMNSSDSGKQDGLLVRARELDQLLKSAKG